MTNPPNRIGGIRGPSGATLDDVVAALESIQSSVASLAQRIDALMLPDPSVVVNGFEWEGLQRSILYQSWLQTNIFTLTNEGTASAATMRGWLGYHLGALEAQGAVQPGGQAAPAKLYLSAVDTAAALTSASGDTAYSRLGTLRDNSTAILQAIGTLPSTPAGDTLKTLLAALVACCEGSAVTPPGGSENPIPAGFCEGFTMIRVSSWENLGAGSVPGGPAVDIWRPIWNYDSPSFGDVYLFQTEGDPPGMGLPLGSIINICTCWDFTGQPGPYDYGRLLGAPNSVNLNSKFTNGLLTPAQLVVNGEFLDENKCSDSADGLWVINFAFEVGVTPSNNVWLGVNTLPCA